MKNPFEHAKKTFINTIRKYVTYGSFIRGRVCIRNENHMIYIMGPKGISFTFKFDCGSGSIVIELNIKR